MNAKPNTCIRLNKLHLQHLDRLILRIDDWQLEAGQNALLIGPSGCGKTSLLHLIAGLLRPSGGALEVFGQRLDQPGVALERFRAEHIGLVFQDFHLLPALSVVDNLLIANWLAGRKPDRARAGELLERLGLAHASKQQPWRLSQGEKQRVAIARALMNRPGLLLADEPSSALDDHNTESIILLLLQETESEGASLVVATHDQRLKPYFQHQLALGVPE